MTIAHIIVHGSRVDDPLGPAVIEEFEVLLCRLDMHTVTRPEYERIKVILAIATLEAHDIESGREGYARAVAKWRVSRWYDGSD